MRQISAVDHSFKPQMGHKDYKIDISCLSYKYAALRWVHRLCLAWNRDNVSEWSNMAISGLLFHCAGTLKATKHVDLIQSGHHYHLIYNLFSSWYSWKIAVNNNYSLIPNMMLKTLSGYFRRGVNFAVFSQTVRVGSNFAKIEKSQIKNFKISALS